MTTASALLSRLYVWYGLLQYKAEFSRFTTVSMAVHNMSGDFFHTMDRVRFIYTSSSL